MGFVLLAIIKFIAAVLLSPVVFASCFKFYHHLSAYPGSFEEYFLWGALAFLLTFLFLYKYFVLYDFSQKISLGLFKILTPFDRFFSHLFPVYFFLTLIAFAVTNKFFDVHDSDPYFMFFLGFFLVFHVILVAQEMQEEEKSVLKPSYLLSMSMILIVVISIGVISFDLVFEKMTFKDYFDSVFKMSKETYIGVFDKMAYR